MAQTVKMCCSIVHSATVILATRNKKKKKQDKKQKEKERNAVFALTQTHKHPGTSATHCLSFKCIAP